MVPESVSHFIGGRQARSALGKTYRVADPATGKDYAQVEVGTAGDVIQAVLAAQTALETGPWPGHGRTGQGTHPARHRGCDRRPGRRHRRRRGAGAGLPLAQATDQAERAADVFRLAADITEAGAAAGAPAAPGQSSFALTRPAGVAGLITSWRTPFLAQARAVAPALAAGCTVVLRPDERAPLPAALLAEIMTTAGLPGGVLNIVHGSLHQNATGAETRDALVAHPGVARLAFAGDAVTGQQVMLEAVAHRKVVSVELEGTAPALIFADADLDQAIDAALFGALRAWRPATHRHFGDRRRAPRLRHGRQPPGRARGPRPRRRARRPGGAARATAAPRALRQAHLLRAPRGQGRRTAGGRRTTAIWPARRELPRRDRARRRDAVDAGAHRAGVRAAATGHAVRHR